MFRFKSSCLIYKIILTACDGIQYRPENNNGYAGHNYQLMVEDSLLKIVPKDR